MKKKAKKKLKELPDYLKDAELIDVLVSLYDDIIARCEKIEAVQTQILAALGEPTAKEKAAVSIPESRAAPKETNTDLQAALAKVSANAKKRGENVTEAELLRRARLSVQQKKAYADKAAAAANQIDEAEKILQAFSKLNVPIAREDAQEMARNGADVKLFLNRIQQMAEMPHSSKSEKKKRSNVKKKLIEDMKKCNIS